MQYWLSYFSPLASVESPSNSATTRSSSAVMLTNRGRRPVGIRSLNAAVVARTISRGRTPESWPNPLASGTASAARQVSAVAATPLPNASMNLRTTAWLCSLTGNLSLELDDLACRKTARAELVEARAPSLFAARALRQAQGERALSIEAAFSFTEPRPC